MQVAIRKSGGANIVSIPKAVLDQFGLHTGSLLNITVDNNCIMLTPEYSAPTLEEVLTGSPKELLALNAEDREWLNSRPIGKEDFS
jgi:antitoxin component of MazEF toxin-antitoxin module